MTVDCIFMQRMTGAPFLADDSRLDDQPDSVLVDNLIASGLRPQHNVLELVYGGMPDLDVRPFGFLNPENYRRLAIDNPSPAANAHGDRFDARHFETVFDVAAAQSVLAHLPFNDVRLCLYRVGQVLTAGGQLYATFFNHDDGPPPEDFARHHYLANPLSPGPFSHSIAQLERAAAGLGWSVETSDRLRVCDGQQVVCFRRRSGLRRPWRSGRRRKIASP